MLNTTSGLSSFLDALNGELQTAATNNAQMNGLVSGGVLPPSAAPPPGFLAKLQGALGPTPVTTPAASPIATAAPATPPPMFVPTTVAQNAPPAAPAVTSVPMVAQQPQSVPVAAPAQPSQYGPLPTFAAGVGAPTNASPNTQAALSFYQQKGLSPIAAAALVGGFSNESGGGLNTKATNVGDGTDGSNSVGIAQWNGARAQGLQQFAAANRLDPNDINTQLQYSWAELNGPEKGTLAALQSATNPVQATAAALGYERPAGWSPQNPAGAKTFGPRLQSTLALANGFSTPFNGAPVGPDPTAFTGGAGSALPTLVASGQGMTTPTTGTPLAPLPGGGPPVPQPTATAYAPTATPAAAAPASQAIAAAAPQGVPYGSVPLPVGNKVMTRDQAENTDGYDHTDYDDAAAKAGLIPNAAAAPAYGVPAASGGPVAAAPLPGGGAPVSVPAQQVATAAAAAPAQGQPQPPSLPQIQAMIQNPATRDLGLKLWQAYLTPKDGFTLGQGQTRYDAAGRVIAAAAPDAFTLSQGQSRFGANGQPIASVPGADKDPSMARPLTADEKAAYGLDPNGAFELQGGKVFAVPGTYSQTQGANGTHVVGVGQALVDNKGTPLYTAPMTAGADPDTVESLANRVYLGDTHALTGLTRQPGLIAAVQARVAQLAKQYQGQPKPTLPEGDVLANDADQSGAMAGARASGTLNARLDTYAKEASGAMDLGIQASRAVPRTTWTPLNRAIQAVQTGSGDPQLAAFVAANNAIINTYAKAINPNGVPTVSDKAHASEVLATAQSPEVYEATVRQLQREINIAHNAARGARSAERSGAAGQDMAVTPNDPSAPGASSVPIGTVLSGSAKPVQVQTPADAMALPSGTTFVTPDGRVKVRP